jgi:hypothetical protein
MYTLKRKADFDRETVKRLKPFQPVNSSTSILGYTPSYVTPMQNEFPLGPLKAELPTSTGKMLPPISTLIPTLPDMKQSRPQTEYKTTTSWQERVLEEIAAMKHMLDENSRELRSVSAVNEAVAEELQLHATRAKTMEILQKCTQ